MSTLEGAAILEVLGAVIVFMSWIVTNTIASRLGAAKSQVDRVTSDDELRQRLASLRRGYREVKATLTRLDLLASELNSSSVFSITGGQNELRDAYALTLTAQTSFFEHEDLQDATFSLRSVASAEELPQTLHREINDALGEAERLVDACRTALSAWDGKRRAAEAAMMSGGTVEVFGAIQKATEEYIQKATPLMTRAIAHREELYEVHGRALEHLVQRLNRLRRLHKTSENLSWYLYAIGTVLVLAGNWMTATASP